MTTWNDIVIVLSALLLLLLLWKEAVRADRARRTARMLATAVAVCSLACLVLPVGCGRGRVASKDKEGVLLTEGYDPDSLHRFLQTAGAGTMQVFSGPGELGQDVDRLTKLHVFGYGLRRKEWEALFLRSEGQVGLQLHPAPAKTGIVSIDWKRQLLPGEKLRIQGTCLLASDKSVQLILSGMDTPLDSLTLVAGKAQAGGLETFELGTVPAHTGRAVYHITLKDADSVEGEPIPVTVTAGKPLTILLLAASPDFEQRFVAGWLAENGHAVAMRTMISKEKYDKAFLNMEPVGLEHLSSSLPKKFDAVITDGATLQTLNPVESSWLRRQVEELGTGLVIRADSTWGKGLYSDLFQLNGVKDSLRRVSIKETTGTQVLMKDSGARVLVSSALRGAGRVVLTTLHTTYSDRLSGRQQAYAAHWSSIIQKVARTAEPVEEWAFSPSLSTVNEPIKVSLQTTATGLPQGLLADDAVYLREDPALSFVWSGSYWPRNAGWQPVHSLRGDTCWWYVWTAKEWRPLFGRQKLIETQAFIAERGTSEAGVEGSGSGTRVERGVSGAGSGARGENVGREGGDLIYKGWWYAFFFLSCLFLWIEKKKLI
jgi:hypothetical protein